MSIFSNLIGVNPRSTVKHAEFVTQVEDDFGFVNSLGTGGGGSPATLAISNVCSDGAFGTATLNIPPASGTQFGRAGLYLGRSFATQVDRNYDLDGNVVNASLDVRIKNNITALSQAEVTCGVGWILSHNGRATSLGPLGGQAAAQEMIGFQSWGTDPNWKVAIWQATTPLVEFDTGVAKNAFNDLRCSFQIKDVSARTYRAMFWVNGRLVYTHDGFISETASSASLVPQVEIRDKTAGTPTGSGQDSSVIVDYMTYQEQSRRYS